MFMSPKLFLPILILIPLAVLAFVFFFPFSSPFPDSKPTTQNSQSADAVTVSAEYLADRSGAELIVFQISLNTHSVDLDNIDFQKSIILEKSGQRFSPLEATTAGSNHHRSAEVKFKRLSPPLKITFLETAEAAQQEFVFDELK